MLKLESLKNTYCNPLPLPNYPRGSGCIDKEKKTAHWMHPFRVDFRETADPTVLYHDGKWYLYPSCGMAYVSDDFLHWEHHPTNPPDVGYAPTVVHFRNRFYLTACDSDLWVSNHPLGSFKRVGSMQMPDGSPIPPGMPWLDPMLFADDDDQLYAYWGLGPGGIKGARLDPENPSRLITQPKILFEFNPDHKWERLGERNEDESQSYVEGPWMFKHGGRYFLTYAAPGTEFRTYGMGAYVSDNPLGPFIYQMRNPILRRPEGLVHGPGHGCLVRGPNETIWAFYTCLVRNINDFERRVGLDPAGIDDDGNLFVLGSSESPQWAPGLRAHPELDNDAGLLSISINRVASASSYVPGREPSYAIDDSLRTFWQAADDDAQPWIRFDMLSIFRVAAVRLHWAEPGLDYDKGVPPGPVQYLLELSRDGQGWSTALDRGGNDVDMLIDYQVFEPQLARYARLTITGHPRGIAPAILQMTLFGQGVRGRT